MNSNPKWRKKKRKRSDDQDFLDTEFSNDEILQIPMDIDDTISSENEENQKENHKSPQVKTKGQKRKKPLQENETLPQSTKKQKQTVKSSKKNGDLSKENREIHSSALLYLIKKFYHDSAQLKVYQVILDGFKSYKDKVIIGPFANNLNCIVGPNGSGKSNIIDDLISLINHERLETGKEYASVSIDIDIHRYSKNDSEKSDKQSSFTLTRKIIKNSSEYHIETSQQNSQQSERVSRQDLQKFLKIFGIDLDFPERFILLQQQTLYCVQKNPKDLLNHVERLGNTHHIAEEIQNLTEQIDFDMQKIQHTEHEISDVQSKIEDSNPELSKIEEFHNQLNEFQLQEQYFFNSFLNFLKLCQLHSSNEIEEINSNIERDKHELDKIESYSQKNLNLRDQNNEKLNNLKDDLSSNERKINESRNNKSKQETQLEKLKRKEKILNKRINSLDSRQEGLRTQNKQVDQELKQYQQQYNIMKEEIEFKGEKLKLYLEQEVKTNCQKNKIDHIINLEREKKQLKNNEHYKQLNDKYHNINSSDSTIKKEINNEEKKIKEHQKLINNKAQNKKSLEDHVKSQSKKMYSAEQEIESSKNNLHSIDSNVYKIRSDIRTTKMELQKIDDIKSQEKKESRFQKAVKHLVDQNPKRIHGLFSDVFKVESNFSTALNSVLHSISSSHVIVKSRKDASLVIQYFTENRIGVVNCDIIDELSPKSKRSLRKKLPKNMNYLSDFLHAQDPQYNGIISKYIGNWIVGDYSTVRNFFNEMKGKKHAFNIVTLKGDVFKKNGEVSGGTRPIISCPIPSLDLKNPNTTKNENEQIQNNLNTEKQLKNQLEKFEIEEKNLLSEYEKIEKNTEEQEIYLRECKEKLEEYREKLNDLNDTIHYYNSEIESFNQNIEKLKRELKFSEPESKSFKYFKSRITQLEKKLNQEIRDFISNSENNENQEESIYKICTLSIEIETKNMKLNDKYNMLMNLHDKKEKQLPKTLHETNEKRKQLTQNLEDLKKEISNQEKNKKETELLLKNLKNENENLNSKTEETENNLKKINQQLCQIEESFKSKKQNIQKQNRQKFQAEERRNEIKNKIEKTERLIKKNNWSIDKESNQDNNNHGIEFTEEIDQNLEHLSCELNEKKTKNDIDSIINSIEEPFEVVQAEIATKEKYLNTLQQKIDFNIVEQNLNWKNQVKKLEKEKKFILEHLETSKKRKEKLEMNRFRNLKKTCDNINHHLSNLFRKLVPQGDCCLSLPPDRQSFIFNGISIQCKPDQFEWKPLERLSGGQKALVACAVSLSLQRSFPSPFFFCDEIDAALDYYNASRVASVLQQSAIQTQMICITLRHQTYERAHRLIGVYQNNNLCSATITRSFS